MTDDMMRLVEPLIPALRRYARSLLRDVAAADDLAQDCLERVIGRWHQHRADGNARSWVFAILHNLAVSRLKQTARRGTHMAIDDASEAMLARPASQEDSLAHRDLLRGLQSLQGHVQQRADLRAMLRPIAEEPVPPELNLARMVDARRRTDGDLVARCGSGPACLPRCWRRLVAAWGGRRPVGR